MIFLLHVENRVGGLGFLPRVIRCGDGNLRGRHLRLRDAADRHIRLAGLGNCRGNVGMVPAAQSNRGDAQYQNQNGGGAAGRQKLFLLSSEICHIQDLLQG